MMQLVDMKREKELEHVHTGWDRKTHVQSLGHVQRLEY